MNQALADDTWGHYHPPAIGELVQRMRDWLGVEHVWPCSSGTIAVELALRGCGVRAADEVILAGYDFPGNFRAIEALGARPVLVDVVAGGWTIDASRITDAISSQTSALLVSHLHGELLDMPVIAAQCREANIALVEDACQVPGATVGGRQAGTHGDAGVFSFGGSKLLTAGRGGAVVTDRDDVLQRIRIAADRGNDAYPLSALQAAALVPQFDHLDELNRHRWSNARRISESLRESTVFRALRIGECATDSNAHSFPVFYKFPLLLAESIDRQAVVTALQAEGMAADAGFRGFALRAPRRCRVAGSLEQSRIAANRTVLVHHPLLLGDDTLISEAINALEKVSQWAERPVT